MKLPVPRGFVRLRSGNAEIVVQESGAQWARDIIDRETLHGWASRQPDRRELPGRVPAFSVPLPNEGRRVVVRHAHHGGLVAPLLTDRFLPPTRAPYELLASYVLANSGVRTPPVLAYAIYHAGPLFRRSDFVTLELPGRDLGSAFMDTDDGAQRRGWLPLVGQLIQSMTRAGAWHPDLNVRNILLVPDATGSASAFVLDVDRVQFVPPGDPTVHEANLARLERSVRKWRALHGRGFDDDELGALRQIASAPAGA